MKKLLLLFGIHTHEYSYPNVFTRVQTCKICGKCIVAPCAHDFVLIDKLNKNAVHRDGTRLLIGSTRIYECRICKEIIRKDYDVQ